jgi:hypothetical protein
MAIVEVREKARAAETTISRSYKMHLTSIMQDGSLAWAGEVQEGYLFTNGDLHLLGLQISYGKHPNHGS